MPWIPRAKHGSRIDNMRRIAELILPLLLAGCFLVPHKIEVQQGNFVDHTMLAKLKPDMTRSQVRFVLGTPLIADPFHPDRWDYVYLSGKAGDVRSRSRITVVFEGDKLKRLEGDVIPFEIRAVRSTPEEPAAMTKANAADDGTNP
jgi:outer membrane protein assembly factor BamE